jgi:hypothetical protein
VKPAAPAGGQAAAALRASDRERLVQGLQSQRQAIAEQLQGRAIASSDYPRSMTMRVLTQNPGMVLRTAFDLIGMWRSSRARQRHD